MTEAGFSSKPTICKPLFCSSRNCKLIDPNLAGKTICNQNAVCPLPEDLERLAKIQEGKELANANLGFLAYKKLRETRDIPINTQDWCCEQFNEESDKAVALKKKEAIDLAVYNLQLIDSKRKNKMREDRLNNFSCKEPRNNTSWMCRLFTENCDESAKYYPYQTACGTLNFDKSITKSPKRYIKQDIPQQGVQTDFLTTANNLHFDIPPPDPDVMQFHCHKARICRNQDQELTRKITEIPCCINTSKVEYIPQEKICEMKKLGKVKNYADVMNLTRSPKYTEYICMPCQNPAIQRYIYDPSKDWNNNCPMKCAYQQDMTMWQNYSKAIDRERDCQYRKCLRDQMKDCYCSQKYAEEEEEEVNFPFPFFSPRLLSKYEKQSRAEKKRLGQQVEYNSTTSRLGFACDLFD